MYEKVRMKSTGITGTVVDIFLSNGETIYTVESNIENAPGGYGGKWKLYECTINDLEFIAD
jgi:hypothetical protein